jgi:hypothetical protein
MRTTRKNSAILGLLVAAGLLLLPGRGFAASAVATANTEGGITVTPATMTLSLPKGAKTEQGSMTITNRYSTGIALHFAFAQAVKTPGSDKSALDNLVITPADVTVAPKTIVTEVITLTDSSGLAPGSQQIELIMTEQAVPGAQNVSVVPSIRLPLIVVKQDGAVTSFSAAAESTPSFSLSIPSSVVVRVKNTGNMLAIPRGFVSVTDPRGREVSKGVLNTSSLAVAPGAELKLETPMILIDHPWPPGPYHVHVSYGIGGGMAPVVASSSLFYLPIWQILLAAFVLGMIICIRQIWLEWATLRAARGKSLEKKTESQRGKAA